MPIGIPDNYDKDKIELMIKGEKHLIDQYYRCLGERYYKEHLNNPEEGFKQLMTDIEQAHRNVDAYRALLNIPDSDEPVAAPLSENKCRNCGEVMPDDHIFCIICGHKLSEPVSSVNEDTAELFTIEEGPVDFEMAPANEAGTEGITCPSCGVNLPDFVTFCIECGYKVK